jgi:general secretion pathway protein A
MYREHFGLKLKPFSITPDPKFLYMSPGHKEALSHLLYGIKEGSGFVVITGEVGTGKTTILNAFLLRLPPRMPKVVIKNPHIKPENLYYLLGEAIGMPEDKRNQDCIHEFEEKLKTTGGAVLIVDEAQGLSMEMLEEIRLLSNLETAHEKLVQIMILGQQELNEKLNSPQLRQLKQRIGVKYHIPPLDNNEAKDYIDHRLRVAGYEPMAEPLFTSSALGEIYRYTRGFPRLINIVCDNVLLAAYTEDAKQISIHMVRKVVADLEKTYGGSSSSAAGSLPAGKLKMIALRTALGMLVLALAAAGWLALPRLGAVLPGKWLDHKTGSETTEVIPLDAYPHQASGDASPQAMSGEGTDAPRQDSRGFIIQDQSGEANPPVPPSLVEPLKNTSSVTVTVGAGDTVAKLAAKHYGRIDTDILAAVRKANPSIPNVDLVFQGQKIILPVLRETTRTMFTVSVASYHSLHEATAVFVDLVKKGFQATIYPYVDGQGITWYRITIGTFTEEEDAKSYAQELKPKGFLYAKPVRVSLEG